MQISPEIRRLADEAEIQLKPVFDRVDEIARKNTEHVLDCFRAAEVGESMFTPSTGYGYGDRGRDAIDALAAQIFRAEAGFMRPSLTSGTHTITVALFGLLRPGDWMYSLTGNPYDTLLEVVGIIGESGNGSLRDFGVRFHGEPMKNGEPDLDAAAAFLRAHGTEVRVMYIQRSKGYENRPTLTTAQIRHAAWKIRETAREMGIPAPYIVCDNCYGEFTEEYEPTYAPAGAVEEEGVDIIMGSLIKNPGGGMADTGGYICGTARAVELCGYRLTCPGVGLDGGPSLGQNRNMLRGLFYAPHTTAQAIKTAHLAAYLFAGAGFSVNPAWDVPRSDIIEAIECGTGEGLCAFCRGIQGASPIDSHVIPEPYAMPGYPDPVVMAAGAFVGGASIELSADGPMREPYIAYMQGGLTYESGRLGIMAALEAVLAARG